MTALYLCDKQACVVCSEECFLTKDINHAVNFKINDSGFMVESSEKIIKQNKKPDAKKGNISKNGSGYYDPTAYEAIKNVSNEDERFRKLLQTIFDVCELSGFHVESRIVIKDKETGKVWR